MNGDELDQLLSNYEDEIQKSQDIEKKEDIQNIENIIHIIQMNLANLMIVRKRTMLMKIKIILK